MLCMLNEITHIPKSGGETRHSERHCVYLMRQNPLPLKKVKKYSEFWPRGMENILLANCTQDKHKRWKLSHSYICAERGVLLQQPRVLCHISDRKHFIFIELGNKKDQQRSSRKKRGMII
jgi:hypothetical protein